MQACTCDSLYRTITNVSQFCCFIVMAYIRLKLGSVLSVQSVYNVLILCGCEPLTTMKFGVTKLTRSSVIAEIARVGSRYAIQGHLRLFKVSDFNANHIFCSYQVEYNKEKKTKNYTQITKETIADSSRKPRKIEN